MVRRLLADTNATVFNLEKCGSASDLTSIELVLKTLGPETERCHQLLRLDLAYAEATTAAVQQADPDLVLHLAAESHVDRSIAGPGAFISSNVNGTFHLLQAVCSPLGGAARAAPHTFRFHQISTDEVFRSLEPEGRFSETTPYTPAAPTLLVKAASYNLAWAWHHTFELPVMLTNCSNNYRPWQFPEKLIPVVILKAASGEPIQIYGDGLNLRD